MKILKVLHCTSQNGHSLPGLIPGQPGLLHFSGMEPGCEARHGSIYELSYTPTTRGRHELTVYINKIKIKTFQVFVQHPPTELGTPLRVIEKVNPWYIAVGDRGELFNCD